MDTEPEKSLERVISQRALQMSSSFPCKAAVAGFLCGVCVTYLCVAASTSFRVVELGIINETTDDLIRNKDLSSLVAVHDVSNSLPKQVERGVLQSKETEKEESLQRSDGFGENERLSLLYSAWSSMLDGLEDDRNELFSRVGLNKLNVPEPPHIENCKLGTELNQVLDNYRENGSFPPWTIHKALLGLKLLNPTLTSKEEHKHFGQSDGANPPWIVGSEEDNFPLTRKVQLDIWMHQHPRNCSDPQVRFLIADWERLPGFGLGAQIAGMCGLLAIAINEQRVLVTNYFNRADHEGCQGSSRSRWSCYFLPETSKECRDHAFKLARTKEAWVKGIITGKDNYTSKEIWAGRIPRLWGNPWDYMQSTTEIDGNLIWHHRKMDRRWWNAQAVRYLMRFQSEYMCRLLNIARHKAFGMQAAELVLENLGTEWPKMEINKPQAEMEKFVWSNYKPWIPRPLLSLHVRMGDKACEMKLVGFETYMQLADRVRRRFPSLNSIWLSTEMQEVIDKSKLYPWWTFYYTNVTRQVGNTSMAAYEASLGRETSSNYPLINFLMATEADFFIGALGSTWCFLIDGMRSTGGKVMAGYLSVNKDRFW